MFALGFETKQKKWCRESCRVCISPSKHPGTDLSCRAPHQSCHWRLMVRTPGPSAGQGRAGGDSAPRPISRTRDVSTAPHGMWHPLQTLQQGKLFSGLSSHLHNCHCSSGHSLDMWMSHCPAQHGLFYPTGKISKHHTAPQTRHNYLVTDIHNCDGAAIA